MNTQLLEAIIQIILALSKEEQAFIVQKLFLELSEPSTKELMQLSMAGGSFRFLEDEPELYTLADGEPIA
ncbi:MAG: hypothetical protein F6K19_27810 [Cyanothece sp. SIO1E1]|nr:hypothetical protein [Cyanothece sp. SIO1E1]